MPRSQASPSEILGLLAEGACDTRVPVFLAWEADFLGYQVSCDNNIGVGKIFSIGGYSFYL